MHSPNPGARQHGRHGHGRHGHIDGNLVPFPYPIFLQGVGKTASQLQKFPAGTEATSSGDCTEQKKKKKRMDLNQTRHYDSLWTSSPWQYNAHQFLHLKEEQPRVWSEPDCSCHWEKKKSGAESHICCSHCLWEAPARLSLLG